VISYIKTSANRSSYEERTILDMAYQFQIAEDSSIYTWCIEIENV